MRRTDTKRELELQPTPSFIAKSLLSWWGHLQRNELKPIRRIWEVRNTSN